MKPYNNLKSIVFTITTAFLFLLWTQLNRYIESNPIVAVALGGLISLGSYRLILKIVQFLLMKSTFVKKKILGNQYMEGTWIGCYIGICGTPRLYIEVFEQSLDELVIRGKCFELDNSYKGSWTSDSVAIDEKKGIMRYTYESDMLNNSHKNEGIAIFNFERTNRTSSPQKLIGYSSDIFNNKKIKSMEKKIDDSKFSTQNELLREAQNFLLENKDFFGLK